MYHTYYVIQNFKFTDNQHNYQKLLHFIFSWIYNALSLCHTIEIQKTVLN